MSVTLLSMIFAHLLCNAIAEDQPLPPNEAYFCSANFEELKVTLNPNLTLEEFHRLKLEERAKASVQSYRYYKAWLAENAHITSIMQQSIDPLVKTESLARLGR